MAESNRNESAFPTFAKIARSFQKSQPSETTSDKRRMLSKKILRGFWIMLVVIVAIHLSVNVWSSYRLNNELSELRRKGEPLAISDLSSLTPIPDSENAALIYNNVSKMLSVSDVKTLDSAITNDINDDIDLKNMAKYESLVKNNPAVINSIRQAANMPKCRFAAYNEPNLLKLSLSYLKDMRRFVRLMRLTALSEARHGDIDNALKDIVVIFRISDQLSGEPFLIPNLVTISSESTGYGTLLTILKDNKVTRKQVEYINTALPHADWLNKSKQVLQYERAFGIWVYQYIQKKGINGIAEIGSTSDGGHTEYINPIVSYIVGIAFSPVYKIDEIHYLEVMNKAVKSSNTLPYDSTYLKDYERALQDRSWYMVITNMICPIFSRYMMYRDDIVELHGMAQAALAIHVYKSEHGHYPSDLNEAASKLGMDIPKDIYSDSPLHYKSTDNSYILYSVGENRKDDGGMIEYRGMRSDNGDLMWSDEIVKPSKYLR